MSRPPGLSSTYRRALIAVGALVLAHAIPSESFATPITHVLTGSVTFVNALLTSQFSVGDPVTYQIVYEPTTVASFPTPIDVHYAGAFLSVSGTIGTYAFSSFGVSDIDIINDSPGDFIGLGPMLFTGDPISGFTPILVSAASLGGPSSMLATDALSALPPDMSNITFNVQFLRFFGQGDARQVDWVLESWQGASAAVPEPSSLVLLASSLAGLAGAAWRARRAR